MPIVFMLTPLRQPGSVNLRWLLPSASFVGCADITVSSVTEHGSDCTPGCLFAALPGTHVHGREFIPQALLGGAAAILTDRPLADVSLPQCIVPDARHAYGLVCHGLFGRPAQRMAVAGVTGTNGKTTTTWILRSLLESASRPTGVIGTIEYNDGLTSVPAALTTPDALTIARSLAAMRDRQTRYAALELSSHALHQGRTSGLSLDVGIITNVTRDHLDYHASEDEYLRAKANIARHLKPGGILALNADDPRHRDILDCLEADVRIVTFGCDSQADVRAELLPRQDGLASENRVAGWHVRSADLEPCPAGARFRLKYGVEEVECRLPLPGRHNVSNALAAACAALHFGLSLEEIAAGLEECCVIPGRLERVDCGQPFEVFVDYAHTDDALARVIGSVREMTAGRVIVVFGAGGNRDRGKRPGMGRAAAAADRVILTSDNPRDEDPKQIIEDILAGFAETGVEPWIEADRQQAIQAALETAQPGDAVLIAGKGHEKVQIIGDERFPFDDAAICRNLLRRGQGAAATGNGTKRYQHTVNSTVD
jgi:UDP-N-acetylmuramoyl-L-alanyl-D-glutamate--2,6-diaminopimelate ligase